jgi:hypothetical protein
MAFLFVVLDPRSAMRRKVFGASLRLRLPDALDPIRRTEKPNPLRLDGQCIIFSNRARWKTNLWSPKS